MAATARCDVHFFANAAGTATPFRALSSFISRFSSDRMTRCLRRWPKDPALTDTSHAGGAFMTIFSGVAFFLSTSTIAGTTAAKAALTRIVFGIGAIASVFIATMALRFRKSNGAEDKQPR
jgi:hypothetical protein